MATGATIVNIRADLRGVALRAYPLWRRDVAHYQTILCAWCLTFMVSDSEWLEHWLAGRDPATSVIEEMFRSE